MTYFLLAYLAGALTILAPCILPVVPFVFARVDQPFVRSGLPLLAGLATSFAVVASLGAVAGNWAVEANVWGRTAAMCVMALVGASLVAPRLAERLTRPLVALGSRLSNNTGKHEATGSTRTASTSFVLGVATGLLWAPCAGPVLGLVLTAAALHGPSVRTSLLLLAYAAGAATSLAIVLHAGRRVFTLLKHSLGIGEGLRRGVGVAVLAGLAAVAFGLDTGALSALSRGNDALERALLQRVSPASPGVAGTAESVEPARIIPVQAATVPPLALPSLGNAPSLAAAGPWLNSPALTDADLRGKVVLVEFWTFGCINCRNALPHVREWYRKYKDQGLVVIGVHAPEFAFEKSLPNVKRALVDLDVPFPVAIDNDFAVWRKFDNMYWPALYVIDARGRIRFHHDGEGAYDIQEQVIRQLLDEAKKDARTS